MKSIVTDCFWDQTGGADFGTGRIAAWNAWNPISKLEIRQAEFTPQVTLSCKSEISGLNLRILPRKSDLRCGYFESGFWSRGSHWNPRFKIFSPREISRNLPSSDFPKKNGDFIKGKNFRSSSCGRDAWTIACAFKGWYFLNLAFLRYKMLSERLFVARFGDGL